ncbi:Protein CBG26520 [Caenorhabditis briggsae]|nr:Protein CBG26520 [Caenorhabditis briggsae]CAR99883.1 Protein CBG26520 [Caenorhabditis briggsae]
MNSNTLPPKNQNRETLKKNLMDFMAQNSLLFSISVQKADQLIDILEEIKAEQFASRLGNGNFENSNLDETTNIPIVKREIPDEQGRKQDMVPSPESENPVNQTPPEPSRSQNPNPKKSSEIPIPARSIKQEVVENESSQSENNKGLENQPVEQSGRQKKSQGSATVKKEVLEKNRENPKDRNGLNSGPNGSESIQNELNGSRSDPNFSPNGPISTESSGHAATLQKNQNGLNGSKSGPSFAQNRPNYGPNFFPHNGSFSGPPGVSFGSNGSYVGPYGPQLRPNLHRNGFLWPNPSDIPPPPPPPPLPPFPQNLGYNENQNQFWRPYGQYQGVQNHKQGQKRPGSSYQKKAKKNKEEYNLILPENGSTDMVNWSNLQKIQIARKIGITEEGIFALIRCHFGMEKIVNFHPDDLQFYERMKNLAAYTTGAKNESVPRNLSLEDYKKWCGVVQPIKKFIEENPEAKKEQFVLPWRVLMLPDSGKEDYRQWNNADIINLAEKMSVSEEGIRRLKYIGLTGHKASLFRQNNMELFRKLNKDDERFP